MRNYLGELMIRDVIRIYIPLFIVIIFVLGLLRFYYPAIRYDYQQRTGDRVIVRIDKFTGESSELFKSRGWVPIESTIPK